eukprot:3896519-Rhodomonas_salina.3
MMTTVMMASSVVWHHTAQSTPQTPNPKPETLNPKPLSPRGANRIRLARPSKERVILSANHCDAASTPISAWHV